MASRGDIRLRVEEMARRRGFIVNRPGPNRGKVNRIRITRQGDISPTTLHKYLSQPEAVVGIELETLAKLCELFQCTPNDILEYKPEGFRAYTQPVAPAFTQESHRATVPGDIEVNW